MVWESKKLSEACILQRGFDLPKKDRESGEFPLVSSSGYIDFHSQAKVQGPGVVTGRSGSIGQVFYVEEDFWPLNTTLYIKDFHGNYPRFIFYLLKSFDLSRFTSGAGVPTLNRNHVHEESVLIPNSIDEQKRIVAILDKAFTAIDEAKAKTEQNLKNACELFDSYLQQVFSQQGEGWVEKKLVEACILQRGFDLPKKNRAVGKFPLVSSSGVIDSHVEAKVNGPGVVTGRSGSIGNVFYVEEDFWPLNTTLYIKEFFGNDEKFICWLLRLFDLTRFTSGTGVPTLNRNFVHDELVWIPVSKKEQKQIVKKIELVDKEIKSVCSIYKKKLILLEDLKKSLLQKAFSGELSANQAEEVVA